MSQETFPLPDIDFDRIPDELRTGLQVWRSHLVNWFGELQAEINALEATVADLQSQIDGHHP